jgi:Arc/MetJ-type ribon-helix-helix transcriptional regulator
MTKPTTIRLSEDLLKEIEEFVQEAHLDRSAYLREILQKGFSLDKQQRILQKYSSGELSFLEVCRTLGWNPWEFFDELKARNFRVNVEIEDFLDSADLPR